MELRNISKWIVIAGTLIIWTVKLGIRPYGNWDQPMKFFWGITPNLAGSFLIPFGACWLFSGKKFLLARIFHIHSFGDLRLVCFMGFGLLIINEYLQLIPAFGRTFDYFDLIASAIGLLASYIVFGKLFSKMSYLYYPD